MSVIISEDEPVQRREFIHQFWDERATMGEAAGTNDVVLKRLELSTLLKYVPENSRVLDIGCGTGDALITLLEKKSCRGLGIDFSQRNIDIANENIKKRGIGGMLDFAVGEVPGLTFTETFSVVITERCLINLPSHSLQRLAFQDLQARVAPGGIYLMIENSIEGLERTNILRRSLGLTEMEAAWHNIYFSETELERWQTDDFYLREVIHFSSTYFLLSRGVYARLAKDRDEVTIYESPINLLSLQIPLYGDLGATRLWIWQKREHKQA